jgi:hypothetical protein
MTVHKWILCAMLGFATALLALPSFAGVQILPKPAPMICAVHL